jgi:hypothetical protein
MTRLLGVCQYSGKEVYHCSLDAAVERGDCGGGEGLRQSERDTEKIAETSVLSAGMERMGSASCLSCTAEGVDCVFSARVDLDGVEERYGWPSGFDEDDAPISRRKDKTSTALPMKATQGLTPKHVLARYVGNSQRWAIVHGAGRLGASSASHDSAWADGVEEESGLTVDRGKGRHISS